MKKLLILLGVLLGALPYGFLATSVQDVKNTDEHHNCTVTKARHEKTLISFGSVYYDMGMRRNEHKIILPYFFAEGDVYDAECGKVKFQIGAVDFVKPGEHINIWTREQTGTLFGHEILRERGIFMFGSGWDKRAR